MRTVYNLEYKVVDKLGRGKSHFHVGVFSSVDDVEKAKQNILAEQKDKAIAFDLYPIDIV